MVPALPMAIVLVPLLPEIIIEIGGGLTKGVSPDAKPSGILGGLSSGKVSSSLP